MPRKPTPKPAPLQTEIVVTIEVILDVIDMLEYGSDIQTGIEEFRRIGSADIVNVTTRPKPQEK